MFWRGARQSYTMEENDVCMHVDPPMFKSVLKWGEFMWKMVNELYREHDTESHLYRRGGW